MPHKPDLGERHRQERGHRQLPPRVARHHESGPPRRQHPDGNRDLPGVVHRARLQQPGLPDLPGLAQFYDRLGFGPFLRRQGERLAQLPLA